MGVLIVALSVGPRAGHAQSRLRVSGSLDFDYRLDRTSVRDRTSTTEGFSQRYSLELDGTILDPRLATFNLSSAFSRSTTDFEQGDTASEVLQPYRFLLNLLPTGAHGVSLRASRQEFGFSVEPSGEKISSTVDEYGITYHAREQEWLPQITLDLRWVERTEERPGGDVSETIWGASLTARKQLSRHNLAFGYEFEHHEGSGTTLEGDSHSLSLEDHVTLGERAQLTAQLNYRTANDVDTIQVGLTLTGPLTSTTDGSVAVSYGVSSTSDDTVSTTAASGSLVQRAGSWLIATGSAYGIVSEGETTDTRSIGGQSTLTVIPWQFLNLSVLLGYQMAAANGDTANALNAGAGASTTIVPLTRLFVDYAMTQVESLNDRERHSTRAGAEITPAEWLSGRAEGEYFVEDSSSIESGPVEERGYGARGSVSVRPLYWLSGTVSGSYLHRDSNLGDGDTVSVLGSVQALLGRLSLGVEGLWERDDRDRLTRRELTGTVTYQLGLWRLSAEYRWTETDSSIMRSSRETFLIRLSRPFLFALF